MTHIKATVWFQNEFAGDIAWLLPSLLWLREVTHMSSLYRCS